MAGVVVGGAGAESPDQLTLAQCMSLSDIAQRKHPWHADSYASPFALTRPDEINQEDLSQNQTTISNFDMLCTQRIEATEVKLGIELYRFRSGFEESGDTAASASAAEKRESKDDSICYDLSPTQILSPVERQELQSANIEVESERLSSTMEYVSALAHLTTFGILGVCIRYGLELLFSGIANVTSEDSPLFIDLPANMLGCFFMGWVGVSLKKEIANFSELLAIGLSTGLMGSITTYASWNQAMIFLVTKGFWVRSIVSLIIGMEMSQMSLLIGIDSGTFLKSGFTDLKRAHIRRGWQKRWNSSPETLHRRKVGMLVFLVISIILWVASLVLTVTDVNSRVRRRLWLACMVGPPGVWSRWLLAKLNGQGIGRNQHLQWLPIGTLLTNLIASTLEAVLAVVILVSPEASLLARGLQLGLLGCMSTVSTFATEVYSLRRGSKQWRAYAYFCIMLFSTYCMGVLVYTIAVLTHHYVL